MRTLLCCALLLATAARAEDPSSEPRIEAGIGGLSMALPDYRGSDRYGTRTLPIPYLAYRTERVQLTREGLRANLFSLDRLTASVSGAASLPGTDDNPERAGMPQIDPTVEVGPSLDYRLYARDDDELKVKFRLPARLVASVDGLDIRQQGWVVVPHLRLDYTQQFERWEFFHLASVGAVWATEDYHEYFYGVAPQYATPARPAYDAHGGYSSARASYSITMRRDKWRIGLFLGYDNLGGAVYEDSPLVRTDHALLAGFFLTYRLYASGVGEPLEGESE